MTYTAGLRLEIVKKFEKRFYDQSPAGNTPRREALFAYSEKSLPSDFEPKTVLSSFANMHLH